jgi:putative phage-type endonuclease
MAVVLPVRQGTDEWLDARREGIGSSDAAVVAGEKGSLIALWGEKTGIVPRPEPDTELAERYAWGHRMEPLLADAYTERTGRPLRRATRLLRHPEVPFALASLDRVSAVKGERRVVEIKVSEIDAKWKGEDLPGDVKAQVQHQLWVTGYDVADVAVLTRYWNLRIFTEERDDTYIDDLAYLERDLWGYVERREPPPVDGSETAHRVLSRLYARANGQMLPPAADLDLMAEELRLAQVEEKAAGARLSTIKNAIRAVIGDADGFEGTWGRITLKNNRAIDWPAIAAELEPPADLVAAHTSTDWKAVAETLRPRPAVIAAHSNPDGPRVLRASFKEEN